MYSLAQIAVFILSYLGVFCGVCLERIAPEEIKSGKKYFLAMQAVILFLIAFFFFFLVDWLIIICFVIAIIFIWRHKSIVVYPAIYFYLGVAVLAALPTPAANIVAALVFLFGFPAGTMISAHIRKGGFGRKMLKTFAYTSSFLILLVLIIGSILLG